MSDIAALKKPTAAVDDRAALRQAIANARTAACEVSDVQASISRAADLVERLENRLAVATAKVIEARSQDADAFAETIRKNADRDTPSAEDTAERSRSDIMRELSLARDALEKLREQLKQKELTAALAANRVIVARNELLAPLAAAVLARIRARRIEQLADRVLLAALLADNGAPPFPDDAAVFFQARDAEISRRQAFGDLRAEAALDVVDLGAGPRGHTPEEANAVMAFHHKWTAQIAALLKDANAQLPGED